MPGDTGQHPVPAPPASDARLRETYLSCFCCPPNIARTLARFHERAASVSADGLYIHQYGGSTVRFALPDGRSLALRETSDYPWDGRIEFTVEEATGGGMPLHLRVPGWSKDAVLTVNGEPTAIADPGAYAALDREWRAGDVVVLDLPMPVRMLRAHRLAEEATNQVAVQRGPVVYAVESTDLPDGVHLEQAALRRGSPLAPVESEVAGTRLVGLEGEIAVLPPASEALYDDVASAAVGAASVRLIPYFAWGNRGPSEMSVWMPVVW
jgi:DUF1680 family protein